MKYDLYFVGCAAPVQLNLSLNKEEVRDYMTSNATHVIGNEIIQWKHIAIARCLDKKPENVKEEEAKPTKESDCLKCG